MPIKKKPALRPEKSTNKRPIEQYDHKSKMRANNPPVGLVTPQTDPPVISRKPYAYDPHLEPQLVWAGKKEHTSFEVPTVSLHVHERIDPATIIEAVRKRNGAPLKPAQGYLFESREENPPLREAVDFYRHSHGWTNRLAATSQPLRDIARTMLDAGMRPEEVFRIETANLDFVQRTILNPFGKTAAARRKLTMTDEVWLILKARTVSSKGPYVFSSPDKPEKPIGSVRKAHDAAVRRARVVPGFRLYDLRHSYASRAVMAGVDLPTLAALLGHTSVQMTMRYVHPAEEHKREATAKFEKFKMASAIELASRSQGVTTKVTTAERVQ